MENQSRDDWVLLRTINYKVEAIYNHVKSHFHHMVSCSYNLSPACLLSFHLCCMPFLLLRAGYLRALVLKSGLILPVCINASGFCLSRGLPLSVMIASTQDWEKGCEAEAGNTWRLTSQGILIVISYLGLF